jgi:thiosulfate reductase cytochrome b subunit
MLAEQEVVAQHDAPSAPLVRRHHAIVRITHWVNAIAIVIMTGSGLRIFNAHPSFGRPGESFPLNPWEGHSIPAVLTFGGWLGGARHWHFAAMWILVANGLLYLGFLFLHGEWRDLAPRRGDIRDAWEMAKYYAFVVRDHPRQGKHNALQKSAYAAMPVLAAILVLSGLAIWKPVTLGFITTLFVNYKWARFAHFAAMAILVALSLGHVFMVFAVDPYSLRSMLTGWYDRRLSPEERNARPFLNWLPRRTPPVVPTADGPSA